jgi:hypothetical protein
MEELLIEQVKQHEVLFDINSVKYRDQQYLCFLCLATVKKRKAAAPSSGSSSQSLSESLQHISDRIQNLISCFDHYD